MWLGSLALSTRSHQTDNTLYAWEISLTSWRTSCKLSSSPEQDSTVNQLAPPKSTSGPPFLQQNMTSSRLERQGRPRTLQTANASFGQKVGPSYPGFCICAGRDQGAMKAEGGNIMGKNLKKGKGKSEWKSLTSLGFGSLSGKIIDIKANEPRSKDDV